MRVPENGVHAGKVFRISLSQGKDIITLKRNWNTPSAIFPFKMCGFRISLHLRWIGTKTGGLPVSQAGDPAAVGNAVYHGMEGMYEDGEIQLKIYAVNELVHIDVIDNGEGMTEAQVQKMMQGDVVSSKRGSGIGVKMSMTESSCISVRHMAYR